MAASPSSLILWPRTARTPALGGTPGEDAPKVRQKAVVRTGERAGHEGLTGADGANGRSSAMRTSGHGDCSPLSDGHFRKRLETPMPAADHAKPAADVASFQKRSADGRRLRRGWGGWGGVAAANGGSWGLWGGGGGAPPPPPPPPPPPRHFGGHGLGGW